MNDCDVSKYPDRFCQAAFSIEDGSGFIEVGFQADRKSVSDRKSISDRNNLKTPLRELQITIFQDVQTLTVACLGKCIMKPKLAIGISFLMNATCFLILCQFIFTF